MSADYKLVPYVISDFEQVRKENKYLVDKTMFFEKRERAGNFLFLVRPRRFGKSLFLDLLESYYEINIITHKLKETDTTTNNQVNGTNNDNMLILPTNLQKNQE